MSQGADGHQAAARKKAGGESRVTAGLFFVRILKGFCAGTGKGLVGSAGVRSPWEESSLPLCEGRERGATQLTHGSVCWAPSWRKHHTGLARVLGRMCSPLTSTLVISLLLPWAVTFTVSPPRPEPLGPYGLPPLQGGWVLTTPPTEPRHVLHCPALHALIPTPTLHLPPGLCSTQGQLVVLNQQAFW